MDEPHMIMWHKTRTIYLASALLLSLACAAEADSQRYWVFFRDKGISQERMPGALQDVAVALTPAARRTSHE